MGFSNRKRLNKDKNTDDDVGFGIEKGGSKGFTKILIDSISGGGYLQNFGS